MASGAYARGHESVYVADGEVSDVLPVAHGELLKVERRLQPVLKHDHQVNGLHGRDAKVGVQHRGGGDVAGDLAAVLQQFGDDGRNVSPQRFGGVRFVHAATILSVRYATARPKAPALPRRNARSLSSSGAALPRKIVSATAEGNSTSRCSKPSMAASSLPSSERNSKSA